MKLTTKIFAILLFMATSCNVPSVVVGDEATIIKIKKTKRTNYFYYDLDYGNGNIVRVRSDSSYSIGDTIYFTKQIK